jgi:hypothetical protein
MTLQMSATFSVYTATYGVVLLGVRRSSAAGAGRLPVCAADRCLPHCSYPIHLLLAGKPHVGCRSQGDCCLHLRYTSVLLAGKPYVGYRSRRAQQMASCTFVSSCLLLAGRPHIGCPSRQIFQNDMVYPKLFRLTLGTSLKRPVTISFQAQMANSTNLLKNSLSIAINETTVSLCDAHRAKIN